MDFDTILHEVEDRILTITLKRPETLNAFSGGMLRDLNSFLEKRAPNFPGKVSRDLPDFFPWWEEPEF